MKLLRSATLTPKLRLTTFHQYWRELYRTRLADSLQQTVNASTFQTLVWKLPQPSCTILL